MVVGNDLRKFGISYMILRGVYVLFMFEIVSPIPLASHGYCIHLHYLISHFLRYRFSLHERYQDVCFGSLYLADHVFFLTFLTLCHSDD